MTLSDDTDVSGCGPSSSAEVHQLVSPRACALDWKRVRPLSAVGKVGLKLGQTLTMTGFGLVAGLEAAGWPSGLLHLVSDPACAPSNDNWSLCAMYEMNIRV